MTTKKLKVGDKIALNDLEKSYAIEVDVKGEMSQILYKQMIQYSLQAIEAKHSIWRSIENRLDCKDRKNVSLRITKDNQYIEIGEKEKDLSKEKHELQIKALELEIKRLELKLKAKE